MVSLTMLLVIIWGVIAAAQSAIRSPGAYYATRVLLGIGESGQ